MPLSLSQPPPLDFKRTALFLDLDGTIAEIAPRPEDVRAAPFRTSWLASLNFVLDGRLGILSGRTLEDVDRILESSIMPVAAVHGLVNRMPDGRIVRVAPSTGMGEAKRQLLATAPAGAIVEDKGTSVAVHYRNVPSAEGELRAAATLIAAATGLVIQQGRLVVELRTPGPDKGSALELLLKEDPFRGFFPIVVGDDLTDESAFAVANRHDGYGVLIGPYRPTAARYRLDTVAGVFTWLAPNPR
jgi:trehalose 6-phosphate phosphatase